MNPIRIGENVLAMERRMFCYRSIQVFKRQSILSIMCHYRRCSSVSKRRQTVFHVPAFAGDQLQWNDENSIMWNPAKAATICESMEFHLKWPLRSFETR